MQYKIAENALAARDTYRMRLVGDTSPLRAPGQFVHIKVEGFYLRRPISVCDWDASSITLLYKVVGEGTQAMAALPAGAKMDVLPGLGNGFDISVETKKPLLVGGGLGAAPLLGLARCLLKKGVQPTAALGFNRSDEVVLKDELESLGVPVLIATADGSTGVKGFVTDALKGIEGDYFYACGPKPMLKAVSQQLACPGEVSLEARMACGIGACMVCTCETISGGKRICKDGPVFRKEEILW